MPNKRIKKKQAKQQLQKKYPERSGQTYSQLREFDYIQQQSEAKKAKAKQARNDRIERKYQALIDGGIDPADARRLASRDIGQKRIDTLLKQDNRVYSSGSNFIGVSWSDKTGESDLRGAKAECDAMSLEEEMRQIKNMYDNTGDDDSDNLKGFALIQTSDNQREMVKLMNAAKKRGYTKADNFNYVDLAYSNRFTAKGYADIMYVAMANTDGANRKNIYEEMKYFAEVNMPELHDILFKD